MKNRLACFLAGIGLTSAILLVYSPILTADFVNYDDPACVDQNPRVLAGLSWPGVQWAFTTLHFSNWIPLTWLSLQWDAHWWGNNPRGYHLTNLLLHMAGTLMVGLILHRLTPNGWLALAIAGLYALHPLHVESTAWVAERKGILSTFFAWTAVWLYLRWQEHPTWTCWTLCTSAWIAALLAKQMFVTFPIAMLLLDYWPGARWQGWQGLWRRLMEKLPWVGIATAFSMVAIIAQRRSDSVQPIKLAHWPDRFAVAADNCVQYLRRFVWPTDLCVCYQPSATLPPWPAALLHISLIVMLSLAAWRLRKHLPWLFVGWFWFLIVLIPVSGLVQVGGQVMADRYVDLPILGIAGGTVGLLAHLVHSDRRLRRLGTLVLIGLLGIAGGLAHRQVKTWQNSETLFQQAIRVASPNSRAHVGLGVYYHRRGRSDEARRQYELAMATGPRHGMAHHNYANLLMDEQQLDAAVKHYRQALSLMPQRAETHAGLGQALLLQGKHRAAATVLEHAVRLDPNQVVVLNNLGVAYSQLGNTSAAESQWRLVLTINPHNAKAWTNLGVLAEERQETDAALRCYEQALGAEPTNPIILLRRARLWHRSGRVNDAIASLRSALQQVQSGPDRRTVTDLKLQLREWQTTAVDPP